MEVTWSGNDSHLRFRLRHTPVLLTSSPALRTLYPSPSRWSMPRILEEGAGSYFERVWVALRAREGGGVGRSGTRWAASVFRIAEPVRRAATVVTTSWDTAR